MEYLRFSRRLPRIRQVAERSIFRTHVRASYCVARRESQPATASQPDLVGQRALTQLTQD